VADVCSIDAVSPYPPPDDPDVALDIAAVNPPAEVPSSYPGADEPDHVEPCELDVDHRAEDVSLSAGPEEDVDDGVGEGGQSSLDADKNDDGQEEAAAQ